MGKGVTKKGVTKMGVTILTNGQILEGQHNV